MSRLLKLHESVLKEAFQNVDWDKVKEVQTLATKSDGYYTNDAYPLSEFWGTLKKFITQYDIGTMIKQDKWGKRNKQELQQTIYNQMFDKRYRDPKDAITNISRKNEFELFDDLQKDVKSKKFTKYDFARVARTETARVRALYQLMAWKEAGLKYVKYKTRNDSRVGDDHKMLNNKEYEIDWLLGPQGESVRIPNRPNCRCRYEPSTRGI